MTSNIRCCKSHKENHLGSTGAWLVLLAPKRLGETNLVRVLLRTIQFMGVVSVLDLMALFRSWTFFWQNGFCFSFRNKRGRILILLDYRFLQNDLASKHHILLAEMCLQAVMQQHWGPNSKSFCTTVKFRHFY